MSSPLRIAVLGAAGSGKTQLTQQLQAELASSAVLAEAPATDALLGALTRHFDLALLMGLDLNAHCQAPAQRHSDQALRAALAQQDMPFATVYGRGATRPAHALQAVRFHLRDTPQPPQPASHWRWPCEKCSDPACENRLFTALLQDH
jgi:nicotinamide riboside kinase